MGDFLKTKAILLFLTVLVGVALAQTLQLARLGEETRELAVQTRQVFDERQLYRESFPQ